MKLRFKDYIYVIVQLILIILFFLNFELVPKISIPKYAGYIFLILSLFGILIIVVALLQINKLLSPFPAPKHAAILITNGVFSIVRHPIYSGILWSFFWCSIYYESLYKIIITVMLFGLFYFKTIYEERLLIQKFPEYSEYQEVVGRFFPKL